MKALALCGLLTAFVIASAASPATGATWHIYADGSGDFPTIAAAVAAASTNDSILVHAGTYNEHDIYVTKRLYIVGVAGAASTVIDAQTSGRCLLFSSPTSQILIKGFTMRHGTAAFDPVYNGYGGAIFARHLANVKISDCVFENNMANLGGAILARDSSTVSVRRCAFADNEAHTDNFPGAGGAVYVSGVNPPNYMLTVVIDSCLFVHNTAESDGGAVYLNFCDLWLMNSTLHENYAAAGRGTIALSNAGIALERSIVSSSNCYGIVGWYGLLTSVYSCNDFYGNAGGNYGGLISDQTGSNNNISANPLYCNPPGDLQISTISPCTAANSGCGQTIGRYGPACGPNLKFTFVWFSAYSPWLGATTTGMVRVKNTGSVSAGPFYLDYYKNSATPPAPGAHGDERHLVAGLAAGDSVSWTTSPVTYDQLAEWQSYFRVDTDAQVSETNESDNLSGPHAVMWVFPPQGAYPWSIGAAVNSSPVIAPIDEDLSTQEIAFGCDNGDLNVYLWGGGSAPGFPVKLGGPVRSSPAVGNVHSSFWNEIVVGCDDGWLYVYDRRGALLWKFQTEGAVRSTPSLVDLAGDDHLEIVLATGTYLYVLDGRGEPIKGWPYKEDVIFMGTAVGDADGDGEPEIAAVARVGESVTRIYLFEANGELHTGAWPVQIDAVPAAGPAMGNVTASAGLEIVVASTAGRVYAINTTGTVWPTVPQVTGSIGSAPIIEDVDQDGHLDIVVTSKIWALGGSPPVMRWNGYVTAIDRNAAVVSGWPQAAGGWATDVGPVASATALGTQADVFSTSPSGPLYAWHGSGVKLPTFPQAYGFTPSVLTSSAAGDVDGDGWTELFVATTGGVMHGYKMQVAGYGADELWWPMYGHDRARTFCYGYEVPTAVDDGAATPPAVTALGAIYPNPFNPTTRIAFDLSAEGSVEIAVYDVSGRLVATLVDRELPAGRHETFWNGETLDGRAAASGIYFCAMRAEGVMETKKIVLLR
jgi:hypothetical protein